MARRVLAVDATDEHARLEQALRLCIARPPGERGAAAFAELLAEGRQWYVEHGEEAKQLVGDDMPEGVPVEEAAAWVATVRMMLNLDEFLTRE